MTNKHTPPPWTVYKHRNGKLEIHGNERVVDGDEICDLIAENVSESNAELIRRSPELLEENERLKSSNAELLECLIELSKSFTGEYSNDQRGDDEIDEHKELWEEKSRAAIAKAKGGTS